MNPIFNMFKTEWKYLQKYRGRFIIYMSLFLIAALVSLLTPLVIGKIFNFIQAGEVADPATLMKLLWMISLIFVIQVIFWLFHGTARVFENLTGFMVHRNYTNDKIKKVLDLPVSWHKDHHSGDTIDKINKGRGSLKSFSEYMTFQVLYAIVNIFGAAAFLFFIDFKIGIFVFLFSSLVLFISMSFDKKMNKKYKEMNKFSNKLSSAVFDYVSNIVTVLTLRLKKTVRAEVDKKISVSYPLHKKIQYLNESKWAIASISVSFMVVVALAWKAYSDYNANGIILLGTLYMLYGYINSIGRSFNSFGQLYGSLTRESANIESAYPIDEAYEKVEAASKDNLAKDWKRILIRGLGFTYNKEGNERHIDDVEIVFNRGEKVALIGESGSGKSTILSLFRGLYDVDSGSVYCDGKKLKYGLSTVGHSVTLIPQDPELFNNSIRYNIAMGSSVSKKKLEKAISMAQFEKVVKRLNKGLDTNVLEKGVSLSGGEKQRLALARGILAAYDSDIVLLDEPTSSVDSLNEIKIHDNLFKEFKDKTIISSIHRLHLLPKFDYIYMFDKGKIVAHGTYEKMKKNPKFARVLEKHETKK
ncbi:MAG: ABC transporter ATP-binding protein [Nanoarchaeota archaeon]|jgi:ATP-binding cassette subfamily B protein|nr:ABC transporter ATP-binding protein [Nanoarchaeota archaeon]